MMAGTVSKASLTLTDTGYRSLIPDIQLPDNGGVAGVIYSGLAALSTHSSQVHSTPALASNSHLISTLWASLRRLLVLFTAIDAI